MDTTNLPKRITPEIIEELISEEHYYNLSNVINSKAERISLVTQCVLVLRNGFIVTGESACASKEIFTEELGRKIAKENAFDKLYPILGYALVDKQHCNK